MNDLKIKIGRREVLAAGVAGGASVALAGCAPRRTPRGEILYGVAASSAQTESRQGRGRSNWDVWADTPGKIKDGSTNARGTEFDIRFEEDLDLLQAGGVQAFRFSTAWPRVQPNGPGAADPAGLDLYSRMVDAMLERNIQPWVTLFHWDVPVWAGDFRKRDIAYRMAEYADLVVAKLGDRVKHWIALNEPNSVALAGYALGMHAPGLKSGDAMNAAIHHQNLAIGLIVRTLRARAAPGSLIGTTHNVTPMRGATGSIADRIAAAKANLIWNETFLDPLFGKDYPLLVRGAMKPLIKADDMDIIAADLDFLGLNYYSRGYIKSAEGDPGIALDPGPSTLTQTAAFPVEPDGLTESLVSTRKRYGDIPIYITETGFALDKEETWDARLSDARRTGYLDQYLGAAAEARRQGVDLRGIFYWSATDNWEWIEGYSKRFGLISVDPATQQRAAKGTLANYGQLVRKHFPK